MVDSKNSDVKWGVKEYCYDMSEISRESLAVEIWISDSLFWYTTEQG